MPHQITILDVLECCCDPALASMIKTELSYPVVFYQQGQFRKIRKEYEKSTMSKGDGRYFFWTGHIPRVLKYCKHRNIPIEIAGEQEVMEHGEPKLNTLSLREEQLRLVRAALRRQRGVLIAPTGTGKTAMAIAVISAYLRKHIKVLWLCHTKDLMYQAGGVAERELGIKVSYFGDGKKDTESQVTMATRQSFINIRETGWEYDLVIVDECHHLAKFEGQYPDILKHVTAPVRIGLTATMPKTKEAELAIEAFIGPVIAQVTIEEGQRRGSMAEINIKFLKVPLSPQIRDLKKYADVYEAGVVKRRTQHQLVIAKAKEHIEKGESVLILVTRIEHGEWLLAQAKEQEVRAFFAKGATEGNVRKELKDALNNKDIHCLIATTIFREGIDIPELNVIINAAGGKSEIATLQAIGRGLRVTDNKKILTLWDILYLDHPYLVSHLAERLAIYSEMGWL